MARDYPVVTITGPRQSGKTTLARKVFSHKPYVNLELPDQRQFALDDPRGFLAQYPRGAVLDEIQRAPDLVSYIMGIVDDQRSNGMFILTGSQQFEVMSSISQSLAGRTALVRLLPFSVGETGDSTAADRLDHLLFRGFYPRVIDRKLPPTQAYADYTATYVERDLRQLSRIHDLRLFETFLRLCAGRVGQLCTFAHIADDAGIAHVTAREWLTLLEASYIVHLLPAHHTNLRKRVVKASKLYFYDVGLACYLMGIDHPEQLARHPQRGSLFENMVAMEILKHRWHHGLSDNLSFFRDANGTEVDVVYRTGIWHVPMEIKAGRTVSPDYFRGLNAFGRMHGQPRPVGIVVYGGDAEQRRTDTCVTTIGGLGNILKQIDAGRWPATQ